MTMAQALFLSITGALAGSMLFFGAVVAPTVFRALDDEHAGRLLRAFFPRYYLWGLALAVIATVAALWSPWPLGTACAVVALLFLYARQMLMPKINAARDAQLGGEAEAGRRFARLHFQSVVINALQLLILVAAMGVVIWG